MLLQRRLGGVNEVVVDKHRRTRRALNMVGHSSFYRASYFHSSLHWIKKKFHVERFSDLRFFNRVLAEKPYPHRRSPTRYQQTIKRGAPTYTQSATVSKALYIKCLPNNNNLFHGMPPKI